MTKRQAIFRILTTYLLVLLPMMVMGLIITQTVLQKFEETQNENINTQLDAIVDTCDDDIILYSDKSVGLMQMSPFLQGGILDKPLAQLEAKQLLQQMHLFDGRVDDILVYYGEKYLYGNIGGISPEVYFKTTLNCMPNSAQDAYALLNSSEPGVIILETTYGLPRIMYHVPVAKAGISDKRSVQYVFSVSELTGRLEGILETNDVLVQLTYQNGEIWCFNSEAGCEYLSAPEAQVCIDRMGKSLHQAGASGNYITVSLWYGRTELLQSYYEMRNICMLTLALGMLLSSVLSVCLSFRRMNNIRQLASSIMGKTVSKSKRKSWINNEFDYIQALVDQSIKDGNLIKKDVKNYRNIILQQISVMVFRGVLRNQQEIQSLLSICGAELVEDYFYLCGIQLENEEDIKQLEPFLQEDLHYFAEDNLALMLCQYHSYDYDMQHRKDMAARLRATLGSIGINCRQIVMSQVYNHISMVNYAYLEISTIMEYVADDQSAMLCWEDLITQQDQLGFRFDNEHLQMFYAAIEQKNGRQAEKILDRIFAQADWQNVENIRYLRYMVTQAIRLGVRSTLEEEENVTLSTQINSLESEPDDQFLIAIKRIMKDFCRVDGNYDRIVQYVNENFAQYDLSLEQLAVEAGVSKAQMSKVFRAKTGVGYIDYVTNLRMEKARELLAETNLGIKEIFSQVGYIDSTNASKKFKAIYGITPSGYRTQAQKKNGNHQEVPE